MKRLTLILTVLAVTTFSYAQSVFKIETGETITLTSDMSKMLVDEWIMEDKSTIIVPPSIPVWEINANKARFGKGCKIIAHGKNGTVGRNSTAHGGHNGDCNDGGQGGNGSGGTAGTNGSSIKITIGLVSVDDLVIYAYGGNGGNGGKGANGGRGGNADCSSMCGGQEGGNGGMGGSGGRAGNGGDVYVHYWIASQQPMQIGGNNKGLRAVTKGGQGGRAGAGGTGGVGGVGKKCIWHKHGGGPKGNNGKSGIAGGSGKDGLQEFMILPSPVGS